MKAILKTHWVLCRAACWELCILCLALVAIAGCQRSKDDRVQGYVEGEFVYVASPEGGRLVNLGVERGDRVKNGELLFQLDDVPVKASRDEAKNRLIQAQANLEDARRGKRPSEIAAIEAQIKQVQAAISLSEEEFAREERLIKSNASAQLEYDRTKARLEQDRQQLAQLQAELQTAHLGARQDQIAAAEAAVQSQQDVLAKAEWNLAQMRQTAPQAGLVFDTLYRVGEWAGEKRPVIALLPPENIKVRAFVPERVVGTIHQGDAVYVTVDGVPKPFVGKVSFISPQAEYTPPVIYSEESRSKLVFMIEAVFDPEIAAKLHPGQPVDVRFKP